MLDIEIELLTSGSGHRLSRVAADVFDDALRPEMVEEFLNDPRHHIVVATAGDTVIGFASAVHYVHPDKAPELWVNEVGVAPVFQRRGIASKMLAVLLDHGRQLGCVSAWVLTENDNVAALTLYERTGGRRLEPDPVLLEFTLNREG